MKSFTCIIALVLLTGCATKPPTAPDCSGEFRPVNPLKQLGARLDTTERVALCTGASHEHS